MAKGAVTCPRVRRALANLGRHTAYPKARSARSVYLHILSAAHRHNQFEPFDADARALNDWLTSVQAGRKLCHDAWDSFMAEGPFERSHQKKAG